MACSIVSVVVESRAVIFCSSLELVTTVLTPTWNWFALTIPLAVTSPVKVVTPTTRRFWTVPTPTTFKYVAPIPFGPAT